MHKRWSITKIWMFYYQKTWVFRKTIVCERKNEKKLLSLRWHILEICQTFLTGLVLEEMALPWNLWLQSVGKTGCRKPSPGLTKWDGPEIPQMGDTRKGGSFYSPFFCLEHLLSPGGSLTYCFHDGEAAKRLSEDKETKHLLHWGAVERLQPKWARRTCAHAHWGALWACSQAVRIWGIKKSWIVYSFLENVHGMAILPLEPSSECVLKRIYFCAVLDFDSLQSGALGYARVGD